MPAIKKQTDTVTSVWMIFNRHMSRSNSVTNSAAFADFLLQKEQI